MVIWFSRQISAVRSIGKPYVSCNLKAISPSNQTKQQLGDNTQVKNEVPELKCSICNLTARSLIYICLNCQHGGCYQHLEQWYSAHKRVNNNAVPCPTGCGCLTCFEEFQS